MEKSSKIAELFDILRNSNGPSEIMDATEALRMLGEQVLLPSVSLLLDRRERPVLRCRIAEVLVRLQDQRAVDPLIHTLGDPDVQVRKAAVSALGRMCASEALPEIERLAASDKGSYWIDPKTEARVDKAAHQAIKRIKSGNPNVFLSAQEIRSLGLSKAEF